MEKLILPWATNSKCAIYFVGFLDRGNLYSQIIFPKRISFDRFTFIFFSRLPLFCWTIFCNPISVLCWNPVGFVIWLASNKSGRKSMDKFSWTEIYVLETARSAIVHTSKVPRDIIARHCVLLFSAFSASGVLEATVRCIGLRHAFYFVRRVVNKNVTLYVRRRKCD